MQIHKNINLINPPLPVSAVTVGNFDGVHLGHQELIRKVTELGESKSIVPVLLTFQPHPKKVLFPEKEFHSLFDFSDQVEQLRKLGIQHLVVQEFTREFAKTTAEDFIVQWIIPFLRPQVIVVGYDFSFGSGRHGSIEELRRIAAANSIEIVVVEPVSLGREIISSTEIRNKIVKGDLTKVTEMLGRHYYLEGTVVKGDGRGTKIGFPTANIDFHCDLVPASGVYSTWAFCQGKRLPSVTNIGFRPSFYSESKAPMTVECHILGFTKSVYGENIRLEFVERIRGEERFDDVDALTARIRTDIEIAKAQLDG